MIRSEIDIPRASLIGHGIFFVCLLVLEIFLYEVSGRPFEPDEIKYVTLARKITLDPYSYTLQGTLYLKYTTQDINDVPLFYHPPLVPILLRLFYEAQPEGSCMGQSHRYTLVPILAHLATLLLIWGYWGKGRPWGERAWPAALLFFSPIATLIATQVWLDTVLTFLMLLTLTLYHRAVQSRRLISFFWVGLVLGLALLTKFTAAILVPLLLVYHLVAFRRDPKLWKQIAAAAAPALLVAGPWFALTYHTYGMFLPDWIKPSEEMMRKFPFVRAIVHRSPLFYFQILGLLMPVGVAALLHALKRYRDRDTALLAAMVMLVIGAFTYVGLDRGGYQTRHVLPAVPVLCILAGRVIARLPRWTWAAVALTLILGLWSIHGNLTKPAYEGSAAIRVFLPWKDKGIFLTGIERPARDAGRRPSSQ